MRDAMVAHARALAIILALAGPVFYAPLASFQQPGREIPAAAPNGARLMGIVVSARGPVAGATVTLTDPDWHRTTTLSDDDGRFTFAGLSPENLYTLAAIKEGYLETAYGATSPGGTGTRIAVAAGQEVTGFAVRLARAGVITGTLRNVDGQPAPNVRIGVTPVGAKGMTAEAVTDAHGLYQFRGLPPDEYRVVAVTGVPVFYPGTTNPNLATGIRVNADQESDGIDFSLVLATRTRISGVVLGLSGSPQSGVQLLITSPTWVSGGPTLSVPPGPDGHFMFVNVVPGRYRIQAIAQPGSGAPGSVAIMDGQRLWAIEEVDVLGDDVTGLMLWLQPATMLSGRVTFDGTSLAPPQDLTKVRVMLERLGLHPTEAVVLPDRTFAVEILPGEYQVDAFAQDQPTPGWRLRSAIADGRDLLDVPLQVTWGTRDITGAVFTFSDRHTLLSGTVRSSAGVAVPECTVVVFPTDRGLWTPLSRRLIMTRPATNGQFDVHDLPPGEYFVATVRDLDAKEWRKPEFLEQLTPASVHVSLADGEQKMLDIPSPPP